MNPSTSNPHLPKYANNPLIAGLPPEDITIEELKEKLSVHVDVPTNEIRQLSARARMYYCEDLHRIQIPQNRDFELEFQISAAVREGYMDRLPSARYWLNHEHEVQSVLKNVRSCDFALTNSRCLGLTGPSGSGKSRTVEAIQRMYPPVITHDTSVNPLLPLKQVPCVKIDTPSNRSQRALCKRFFSVMGEAVDAPYERQFGGGNVDEMVTDMARLAREHFLGLLIIDEIQHALGPSGSAGPTLMRFIITLSNELRMPVLFVGTTKALTELRQRLATSRRLIGLTFDRFHENQPDWEYFLSELWRYQYTRTPTELNDGLRRTIYDLTQGIHAFVIALFVLAQRREIFRSACGQGDERLNSETFTAVYRDYFKAVDPVIQALRSGDDLAIEQFEDLPSEFKLSELLAHQAETFVSRELHRLDRATARAGKAIRRRIPEVLAGAAAGLEHGTSQKSTSAVQGLAADAKKVVKAGGDPIKLLEEKGLIKGS